MTHKYIVVSGSKRSGTSAMMRALREAGFPIAGFKFPWVIMHKDIGKSVSGGSDIPHQDEKILQNPLGFWENYPISTEGIKIDTNADGAVVKVVVEGLVHSHKDRVNKVIMMVRNPLKILDSRFNSINMKRTELNYKLQAAVLINNYIVAFNWLRKQLKGWKIVIYEELIANPLLILGDVCKWLEHGDANWGVKAIRPLLDRASDDIGIDIFTKQELMAFYELCKKRDFEKLYAYDTKMLSNRIMALYQETMREANKVTV